MKKGANKLISVFMSVVMLAMLFVGTDISVFNVKAATNTNFTRAEWIHDLVTTFEMEVGENQMPDNYFTDVSSTDTYYEDIMKAVSFGVIDIEAGKEFKPNDDATREFVASTLNFCLGCELQKNTYTFTDSNDCSYPEDDQVAVNRGWFLLSNGKFMPNEKVTGSESQLILSDAKKEIDKQDVSSDYDSRWDINSNVKEVPYGTDVQIYENVVTIKGSDIEINKGDVFVVYQGEIATPFKANDVQKEGNVTTISTEDVTDYSEAFKNVDAEGVIESDELTFEALDGTKLEIENDTDEIEKSKTIKRNVRATTKKLKDAKFSKTFKISGNLSSAINGTFSNIKVKYNISTSSGETFVQVEGDLNMTGSIAATAGMSVPIMQVGIPGVGGVTLSADIKAEGKLNSTIATHVVTGISYSKSTGFRTIRSFKENGGSNTSTEASASMGASLKCGITDLKVITGYVYARAGVKAQIVNTVWESGQPRNCRTFLAYMYASYGAEASCKFVAKKYQKEENIYTLSNSPMRVYHHYEDNMQVSECTRGQTFSYFTKYYSSYWGTGWSGCDSSYGLDDEGKPYAVYEYKVEQDSSKNDYATIVKYSGNMRNLTIPETLDGYTVKKIANDVFEGNKYICTLTIPDTIVEIGAGAFLKCSDLSNVTLSKGLTKLGGYAFGDCDSLTSIEIPKSLKETTSQYYMNYIYDYHYGVFIASDNLKNVTFEEGTTTIANGLFAHNTSLENITIPDTVTEIGDNAFENCTNLKTIKLSSSLTKIGRDAFQYVKGLTTVKIPDTVVEIGAGAFLGCSNLSNVTLSKGLTEMGGYAFGDCDSLTSIEIPKSLKETTSQYYMNYIYDYHYGVFIASDNLKNVTFEEGTTTIANGLFAHNTSLENITIPDTVTEIGDNAFENCTNLKTIKLSSSLTKIGRDAFQYVKGLTTVKIPDTVVEIGAGAFLGCSNLSNVTLSKGLTEMGGYAFGDCDSLTSIEIPKSLKETTSQYYMNYIYDYHYGVFIASDNLKNVTFEEGTTTIANGLFAHNTSLENITIPDTVTEIRDNAFENCTSLKTIKLSQKLETMGSNVFEGAKELKEIEIPDTVTSMGEKTFYNCINLSKVKLPNTRQNIGSHMFYNCTSLENIEFPDTVTYIRDSAFENSGIKKIKMSPNVVLIDAYAFKNTPLEEIQFSGKEEEVGVEAFKNCDSLTAVNIPDKVNTIGKGVFQDCDMLTNVRLGLGISNIPQYAFEHCDKLQSIVIPYNVKSIESNAFANSIAISEVTMPRATTKISENAFSYPSRMTVYGIKGTYAETFANEQGMKFVNKELNAKSVSFNETNVSLAKNSNKKLVITVAPDGFTDEITWRSTNPDVVSVDDNGNITANSVGTATIKVTIGNVSASCNVTVYQPIEWIRLNDSKVSLNVGEKYQLEAYVSPDDANDKTLEWSSSDKSVATVDSNGKITAISKGIATITAKAKGVNDVYDTCVVTVKGTNIVSNVQDMKSQHPYDNNADEQWTYTKKGAKKLSITFSSETELEEGFDFLYILDKNGEQVGKYTGKELAGKTITVSGDTIIVKLETDEGGTAFGFEVTKIEEVKQSSSEKTDKSTTKVSDTKKTRVQFSKPQNITKLTAKNVKKKRVSLKWQKVAKAKGYQIQYALDRKFKKSRKTKNTSKTSYTIKKLKKKKTYYIRVRAYAIINGKKVYGNWCKAKKIKIKR